ncbi:MAG: DUF1329 domain-containing protein [Candidatus Binataceae bacterium]
MRRLAGFAFAALMSTGLVGRSVAAPVKPGDLITPDNAALVSDLVSPGNFILVKQGMRIKVVPTERLEWPPPYKSATEKYSPQVKLNDRGELENYAAGLPFPLLDPNEPQVATKVMWNFSYRPQYTDDVDIRDVEVVSNRPGGADSDPVEHFTIGHFAFYNNVGRTEVRPIPTDPEAGGPRIRYKFGAFPFLEPAEIRGFGLVRQRSLDPGVDDNAWYYNPSTRMLKRVTAATLSDALGPFSTGHLVQSSDNKSYANNLDPDSYFGFAAKIEDFNYRLLGIKPMLACVEVENSPARACEFDNNRTICPENWEMRQLYVIEATVKPQSWSQKIGSDGAVIPKRIFYIDSEDWFITASDQYDREGKLWKTIATFNTYRDRPMPDAKVAIYPFKRMFQVALVDEDVQSGFSSVVYMPGRETEEHECWYINMGIVTRAFLDPHQLAMQAH